MPFLSEQLYTTALGKQAHTVFFLPLPSHVETFASFGAEVLVSVPSFSGLPTEESFNPEPGYQKLPLSSLPNMFANQMDCVCIR